ncbi:hypothetical protein OAU50_03380 [Planctomycetota bacterium]|nr:hypothetical protein [Planctomycetota bacterium]
MIDAIKLLTDTYERKARLFPAFLLIFPVLLDATKFLVVNYHHLGAIGLTIGVLAILPLLGGYARTKGKALESEYHGDKKPMPSVVVMRHRDKSLPDLTKERLHEILTRKVPNARSPTIEEELEDPQAADLVYSAWSTYLRSKTRNRIEFPQIFAENCNYGFYRNMAGVRGPGIAIAAMVLAVETILLVGPAKYQMPSNTFGVIVAVVSFIWIFVWLGVARKKSIETPAHEYALRLAEAAEELPE